MLIHSTLIGLLIFTTPFYYSLYRAFTTGPMCTMILVIHSTFIDLLLKALLKYPHSDQTGTHLYHSLLVHLYYSLEAAPNPRHLPKTDLRLGNCTGKYQGLPNLCPKLN